jgi:hypothetical protein
MINQKEWRGQEAGLSSILLKAWAIREGTLLSPNLLTKEQKRGKIEYNIKCKEWAWKREEEKSKYKQALHSTSPPWKVDRLTIHAHTRTSLSSLTTLQSDPVINTDQDSALPYPRWETQISSTSLSAVIRTYLRKRTNSEFLKLYTSWARESDENRKKMRLGGLE